MILVKDKNVRLVEIFGRTNLAISYSILKFYGENLWNKDFPKKWPRIFLREGNHKAENTEYFFNDRNNIEKKENNNSLQPISYRDMKDKEEWQFQGAFQKREVL